MHLVSNMKNSIENAVLPRFWGSFPAAQEQLYVTGTYPEKKQGTIFNYTPPFFT